MGSQLPLTSAVGEAVVSRGALCAPSTDDMPPAGTLSSGWLTSGLSRAGLVAVARERSAVISRHQRAGGVSAELRRCSPADGAR